MAYKDTYLLGKKSAAEAEHIWLKDIKNEVKELTTYSPIIRSLQNNNLRRRRAYVHRSCENELNEKLKKLKK